MMPVDNSKAGDRIRQPGKPYDLSEEASRRDKDERATDEARKAENDDSNEETNRGYVSTPDGDSAGENRVATSLSED